METPNIIIPEYKDKPYSFQRTMDWLFRSAEGVKRWNAHIEKKRREDEAQMREIAAEEARVQRKTVEGLGQVVSQMPVHVYMRWLLERRDDMKDPAFRKSLLRDNPELRASKPKPKHVFFTGAGT